MNAEEHDLENEIHVVNYITLRRIYDVLLGIYSNINPDEADSMARLHEEGLFASPEPMITLGSEDADNV